jgi:hypothetical protein
MAPIRKLGKTDEFMLYLYARRAQELHALGKNPGLPFDDAAWFVEFYHNDTQLRDVFQAAAADVYRWNRSVLDYGRQGGLFTQETFNNIVHSSDNYIPLHRVFDELDDIYQVRNPNRKSTLGSNPIKKLKGSTRPIKNPFESMVSNAEQTVRATHEAMVAKQIVKLRHIPGMGRFIEEIDQRTLPEQAKKLQDLITQAKNETGGKLNIPDDATPQQTLDTISEYITAASQFSKAGKKGEPIISVFEDGQLKHFIVAPELANSLTGMDVYRLPQVVDFIFGSTARGFRRATTGVNIAFNLFTIPRS